MVGFLLSEACRDLRRAGGVAVSAILLIALALASLGAFWIVTSNLGDAVSRWRDRVRIVVYLKRELDQDSVPFVLDRVREIRGVAAARYVSRAQALASLKRVLGKDADVVDQLSMNPLSASIEITPSTDAATPEAARALLARLALFPDVEEVAGSADWVERLREWQTLLTFIGLAVGGILAAAAILTVTTATTLVLHLRRNETEIMRLVGAPEVAIRLPLLLQGMLQGLIGALLAVGVLVAGYRLVSPHLEPLVMLTLGLGELTFIQPPALVALVGTGTVLGGLGGWLARAGR